MIFMRFFVEKCWEKIGKNTCLMARPFLEDGYIVKETNKTYINSKKPDNPDSVSHYRPISLCIDSYKIT